MGFQKTEQTDIGVEATNAYHRITEVRGNLKGGLVRAVVSSYYDKPAADSASAHYKTRVYSGLSVDLTLADDVYAQLYPQIKASSAHEGFLNDALDVDPD